MWTVGGGLIGWLFDYPWVGVALALVVWVGALNLVAKRAQAQRASIPTGGRTIRVAKAEAFEELREEVGRIRTELQQSEQERKRLEAEKTASEKAISEPNRSYDQLRDEELRRVCLNTSEDLHQFLDDYALDDASRAEAIDADLGLEVAGSDIETMRQFRKLQKRRVKTLLIELQRRGWWNPEHLDIEERESFHNPTHPEDVQAIAKYLEQVGYSA